MAKLSELISGDAPTFTPGSRQWYQDLIGGTAAIADPKAQAAKNRSTLAEEIANITPGVGEVLSAKDAYKAFGDASKSGKWQDYLMGTVSALGAIPLAGYAFRKMPKGMLKDAGRTMNIFAGPTAKTADRAALAKAEDLAKAGASRDQIWKETGWFQGADGKWRFEIDDSKSKLGGIIREDGGMFTKGKSGSFNRLDHPELEAAYGKQPDMIGRYGPKTKYDGAYFEPVGDAKPLISVGAPDADQARGVGLHELQHNVQNKEGFATGSNPKDNFSKAAVEDSARQFYNEFDPTFKPWDELTESEKKYWRGQGKFDLYRKSAGEVEARNVEARRAMTAAERRAKAPWLTQDVPDEQQLIRY